MMKKQFELKSTNRIQVALGMGLMAAGLVLYLAGVTGYTFLVGATTVRIFPAAFVALAGIVQVWRSIARK
jgi:hypothetical protein